MRTPPTYQTRILRVISRPAEAGHGILILSAASRLDAFSDYPLGV